MDYIYMVGLIFVPLSDLSKEAASVICSTTGGAIEGGYYTQTTLSYQWVSQSLTEILCGIYTYPTPGVSVVCYVTVCQPAASNS